MKEELKEKLNQQVEKEITNILSQEISVDNINMLDKLVDIHKDIANEDYWKVKEEKYMYREGNYGEYSGYGYGEGNYGRRGVRGSGRGRYRGGRGSGRYRGEEEMEEMMEHYGNYSEANEEYNAGNYGAEGGMVKSAEGIMKNVYSIIEELKEADSPEVMQVIKRYAKKINEM